MKYLYYTQSDIGGELLNTKEVFIEEDKIQNVFFELIQKIIRNENNLFSCIDYYPRLNQISWVVTRTNEEGDYEECYREALSIEESTIGKEQLQALIFSNKFWH